MQATSSFGRWVKQSRADLGLTQEALAERVSCAVQTIRKIEAGERRPSRVMAERLARALELPADERPAFFQEARTAGSHTLPDPAPATSLVSGPLPLPAYATRFVGREAELVELARLLADPFSRLITLVGAGGMGKTRLAVEAARAQVGLGCTVAFVPLAPLRSTALLAPAIADALGFLFAGSEPPAQQLLNYLRGKEALLVLDNMEHLLGVVLGTEGAPPGTPVGLVAALLEEAPRVKLLVTSRERLNLQGEWVVNLAGLPASQEEQPGEHADAAAVVLFTERARQAQHDFRLMADTRPVVSRICRLLEGMPLAIELAATWVRVLSCAAIAEELERSLDFLQASTRDVPERHRSIRAVFEHSWQLLRTTEQQVLRRLTVFRGGFDRAAAEQVAGASLPLLAALIDKSLVRRVGAERYDLHEVVRQAAAAYLGRDLQEQTATMDRHCAYFAAFLEEREQLLKSALQGVTVAELAIAIDNVRAAWHWAALRRRFNDLRQAIPSLFVFYEIRGSYEEAADLFGQAADALRESIGTTDTTEARPGEDVYLLLGELLANQAWFAGRSGQFDQAGELLQRSLALLGSQSTEAALSTALPFLWMLRPGRGDYAEGKQLLLQALQLQRGRHDSREIAFILLHLGLLAGFQGDHTEQYRLLREALAPAKVSGDPMVMARILGFASGAAYETGAHEEAQQLAQACIAMNSDMGDRFSKGFALKSLGLVAYARGQYLEARVRLEESLALFNELGDRWSMARALSDLGHTLHALEASPDAYQTLLAAVEMAMAAKTIARDLDAVIGLASVLREHGRTEQALELCLHVLQQPAGNQQAKAQARRLRSDLERILPQQLIASLEERVETTSFEALITELGRRNRESAAPS